MTTTRPHRLLSVALSLALLIGNLTPTAASAATDDGTNELFSCMSKTADQLARTQRLYRVVLLGRSPAATAPQGTVWYDNTTGDPWIKSDEGRWVSIPPNPSRSDSEMEDKVEKDADWTSPFRRGLVSTRTTLTSSIIPPMIQAYRALSCRLQTICDLTTGSVLGDSDQTAADGCLPPDKLGLTAIEACTFRGESAARDSIEASSSCQQAADSILAHEAEVLRLLATYDAAVRTSLQYAGVFDRLVRDLRYPLLWPLLELSNLLRDLQRIPCFLGICAP